MDICKLICERQNEKGVLVVNSEGESYASVVMKTGYQEVLNHMLLGLARVLFNGNLTGEELSLFKK